MVFDETFFTTSLPERITAKGTESADQPAVYVTLRSGQEYKVGRVLDVSPQWVVFEVYPPDGKPPRPSSAQAQQAGAPPHDLDRLAVAYEYIVLVRVTLEPKPRDLGFRA
jgi:hypothetical protein